MLARNDFLSSPRENCRAAQANLMQMFPPRIPLTDRDRFFSVFSATCERHYGAPLPGFPLEVLDGVVPKLIQAAWFGASRCTTDGEGEDDGQLLVAAIATGTGRWDLFSTLEGTWQLELADMLKPLVDGLARLRDARDAKNQAIPK